MIENGKLEEENKKLKEQLERMKIDTMYDMKDINSLYEENKKLRKECEENDYLVEDNARWMKKCEEKTMEIKKLKSDLAFERTMLDNVRAEYKSSQNVIKELKERIEALELCIDVD